MKVDSSSDGTDAAADAPCGESEAAPSNRGLLQGEVLPFGEGDTTQFIGRGAEVECSVCVEKGSGRRRACGLKLLRTAKQIKEDAESRQREEGIVLKLLDGYGFISSTARSTDVFFRFGDVGPPERGAELELREGCEVSFCCAADGPPSSGQAERFRATKIALLPAGTVSLEVAVGEPRLPAVVTRSPRTSDDRRGSGAGSGGMVRVALPAGESRSGFADVPFAASAVDGTPVRAGDEVVLDLLRHKLSGKLLARRVSLVSMDRRQREVGQVTALKEGFGFLRCAMREGDLYFRSSEVISGELTEGCEVEFDVADGLKDKHIAERIEVLPPGDALRPPLITSLHLSTAKSPKTKPSE